MAQLNLGLVHTPVTPFTADGRVDNDVYARLIEFHINNGAEALALPMHVGEAPSLTNAERNELFGFVIKAVKGRIPVIAHVGQSGTSHAAAMARHAEKVGASGIIATTPYYWSTALGVLGEHFGAIAAASKLPFYVYNDPLNLGTKVSSELVLKLKKERSNFVGFVDAGLDWQFMIDVVSRGLDAKADVQMISGSEYLISAGAIGFTGVLSPLAAIAPRAVQSLYRLCKDERYAEAQRGQANISALRQAVKPGVAGIKSALRAVGRDCGVPRPPVSPVVGAEADKIAAALQALPFLREEPQGW